MKKISVIFAIYATLFLAPPRVLAAEEGPEANADYRREEILTARFGGAVIRPFLTRAYGFSELAAGRVIGQERVAQILEDRLVQYLDSIATGTSNRLALHLMGLPGVGKSELLDLLVTLGIPVMRVDAQRFAGDNLHDTINEFLNRLEANLKTQSANGTPLVLLVEELDKIPEIGPGGVETTQPFIAMLNEILSSGRLSQNRHATNSVLDLRRVLVVSSMNLSPQLLDQFVREKFGTDRDFYGLGVDDMRAFHEWLLTNPSARYRILSRLFRTNTVGRMAPNTEIPDPLRLQDYREIIRLNIHRSLSQQNNSIQEGRRVQFDFDESLVDFFAARTIYAPSGARETVLRLESLLEQLKGFANRYDLGVRNSLGQPRRVLFRANAEGNVEMVITRLTRRGRTLTEHEHPPIALVYNEGIRGFVRPQGLIIDPSAARLSRRNVGSDEAGQRPFTQREIIGARFPESQRRADGLATRIDGFIIGQGEMTTTVESQVRAFLGRRLPIESNPSVVVVGGFSGLGKSEIAALTSRFADLPAARISLQTFSASDANAVAEILTALSSAVDEARNRSRDGRFMLILEELDKLAEINPRNGEPVIRPAIGPIKELLDKGVVDVVVRTTSGQKAYHIDIRNAFTMVTMNFASTLFQFQADPRLTSFEDVMRAWQRANRSAETRRGILARLFTPDTVNRILSRFYLQRPLEREHYREIVETHLEDINRLRFTTREGRNSSQVFVTFATSYIEYVNSESAVPSEGARNAVLVAQNIVSADLEEIIKYIPRSGRNATSRLDVELQFDPQTRLVVAMGQFRGGERRELFRKTVQLRFPPLRLEGRIPQPRLHLAIHEFGHAWAAVRMGLRFHFAAAVSLSPDANGFVSLREHFMRNGNNLAARIYGTLGARAMERVLLSQDPLNERSSLVGSQGASQDITMATQMLYNLAFELGMNPTGPTIDLNGQSRGEGAQRYANLSSLPPQETGALGMILREMENYLVRDLLAAHPRDWYIERIETFAREGGLTEAQFYELIGYNYPGDNNFDLGDLSATASIFPNAAEPLPQETLAAAAFRQGLTQTTAVENLRAGVEFLLRELETKLNIRRALSLDACENIALGGELPPQNNN